MISKLVIYNYRFANYVSGGHFFIMLLLLHLFPLLLTNVYTFLSILTFNHSF